MALFELTLLAKEAEVEVLSDALMEIDALSVSVEDADADTEHEEALWGEPGMPVAREAWQRSTIKSLFPSEAEALAQLHPGIDGVILTAGGRRATFLPQVWEQLPDPAEFIGRLKQKAGLPASYWGPDIRLATYPVRAIDEANPGEAA